MKRVFYFVSIAILLLGSSIVLIFTIPSTNSLKTMIITSDDDLRKLKLPGTGEISDPYIIENNEFGLKNTNVQEFISLLSISGTTKHITIRDNSFIGGFIGIQIASVNKGSIIIDNNYFEYGEICIDGYCITSYYAMKVSQSSNVVIKENTFKESDYVGYIYGVFFEESYNIIIRDNLISSFYGIYGLYSNSFVITKNTYIETVDVYFEYCSYFNITQNTHDYLFRFKVVNSVSVEIAQNRIIGYNISFGFLIIDSSYVVLRDNVFFKNIVGIRMTGSSYSKIIRNSFKFGFSRAIELGYDTYSNLIFDNHFFYNNLAANPPLQAYDSGNSNTWYDSGNHNGNFWTNLGSNSSYSIEGSAESSDIYPETI